MPPGVLGPTDVSYPNDLDMDTPENRCFLLDEGGGGYIMGKSRVQNLLRMLLKTFHALSLPIFKGWRPIAPPPPKTG